MQDNRTPRPPRAPHAEVTETTRARAGTWKAHVSGDVPRSRAEQSSWCGVVRSPLLPGQQAGLALWVAPGCDRTLGTVKQDRSSGASELGREPSLLPSVVDPIHEANGSLVRSFVPRCC
jgi:hypothetical protein